MINIEALNFGYPKNLSLFNQLSLEIPTGGIYGLLGKNGTGKTSLLKLITGLLFPNAGDCQVLDYRPKNRHPRFLAQLYFLPEEMHVPAVTMKSYCSLYAPFYPDFNYELLEKAIVEFELPKTRKLVQMSYGQKKKFLIAFGLATQSRLFILDEPTNGLDIPSKTQFRRLLASHFSQDRLFIISTHQVHDVEKLIDHIIMLEAGRIIFKQSMEQVSQKLLFQHQTEKPSAACLYSEKQLGGYVAVTENTRQQETDIDLEILFNAILANKQNFQQLFNC